MRRILVLFLVLIPIAVFAAGPVVQSSEATYPAAFAAAEKLVKEGSYRLALERYDAIDVDKLPPDEVRWVLFRRADLAWRAAPEDADDTPVQDAERDLEKLLVGADGKPILDRIRPEILESLGDLYRSGRRRNFGRAWSFYSQALDWWAGSRNIDLAREQYLRIVRKAASSPETDRWMPRGYWSSNIPLDVLENCLRIAKRPSDIVWANYLLAVNLSNRGDAESIERARKAFEAAIAPTAKTDWRDDALWSYGQWLTRTGRLQFTEDGGFRALPDWSRAVEILRALVQEYPKGESRWHDQAAELLKRITGPSLGVAVPSVFLSGSEIEFGLQWRNLESVTFTLTSVDLAEAIRFPLRADVSNWIDAIDPSTGHEVVKWTKTLDHKDRYEPGQENVRVSRKLAPGAYLLEARSGGSSARDLIVVTDLAVTTRSAGDRVLAWVVDGRTGEPKPSASLRMWQRVDQRGSRSITTHEAKTDADGLATLPIDEGSSGQSLIVAKWQDRQAITPLWTGFSRSAANDQWRIYAFTDRPAYRPGETVEWKVTARVGSTTGYRVPAGERLRWTIRDPRGGESGHGELALDSFGSGWAKLDLDSTMPLGVYTINFSSSDPNRSVGSAQLFRLEEYKLPEFRVAVKTEDAHGKPRLFRLGDRVEATVEAEYYFGGPVTGATVEVVVRQSPYQRWWTPRRDYPWYFDQGGPSPYRGSGGKEIKRETLTTDKDGHATITFDTPPGGTQDYEYSIEARVTDASRREITGEQTIRVTRAPYSADARPEHYLYGPGDQVEVTFRAIDANDQPAAAMGKVRIAREQWREVWLDPDGRRITGDALEAAKARAGIFPPPQLPGHHPWIPIERKYERDVIRTESFKTDSKGRATIIFTPDRDGYYSFAFTSRPVGLATPRPRDVVDAQTTVWVASKASTRIGYVHEGGVQIILDAESARAGRTMPVMIVAPTAGRDVLFTVETNRILSRERVHMDGNVRLVELPLGDEDIPNVYLTATMVSDFQIFGDTKELVVPPVEKFLDIHVTSDKAEYGPRDKGRFDISVKDADGKPVAAQVALGVADESVYAISKDLAGDPRKVFYGDKRYHNVQAASSFGFRPYRRMVESDGRLVDERYAAQAAARRDAAKDEVEGGAVARGISAGVLGSVAPPPAPAAMAQTVTAEAPMREMAAKSSAVMVAPGPSEAPAGEVVVRHDFRSTVFWQPDIVTGTDGRASVDVTFPDSLTTWRATARGVTRASQFGIATTSVKTKKPLIVRLQGPRFFVVGDEAVVSAVINNNTDAPVTATPSIDVAGLDLEGLYVDGKPAQGAAEPVAVDAGGEARVDWVVRAREPGEARLRVAARAGALSDAMEKSFPVDDHGIDQLVATSGKMRGSEATIHLRVPAERRKETTKLTVDVTPSIAVTMLDAMPYLIDYPYGCTEQTMSRFLPTVVVAKTLADLGVSRETVATRLFGGIEASSAAKTHTRPKQDLARMDGMVRAGLTRLYDFQHGDGGWGWWKEGESDRFMTAYVVWGLALARDAGIDVRRSALDRAVQYLTQQLVQEESDPERQSWMLQAISAARHSSPGSLERKAFDNAYAKRDRMAAYGVALLALAAHQYGLDAQAQTLARNLENGVVIDRRPDQSILVKGSGSGSDVVMATAHWGSSGRWWRWYDGPVESTAFALRALSAIDPSSRLVEPTMNWLVKNRRGAQWSNTRDTAIAILALDGYLQASHELGTAVSFDVTVNGRKIGEKTIRAGDAISAPSRFEVSRDLVRDGDNEIVVRRTSGDGPLYLSASARFFSREEPVEAAGNELFVKREYFRLEPHPTLLKGYVYDRVPLEDGGSVRSGDRIEVVVTIEAKNDYEYLMIEDLKPAGFEAVQVQSGQPLYARRLRSADVESRHGASSTSAKAASIRPPGGGAIDSRSVYQELRDRKIAMFIDKLGQGIWEIHYTLRAEVPGTFHALPVIGQAMYVPEIRGNGNEVRVTVKER